METDANVRVKRGPKPDPLRRTLRASFSDWSDRTFDTYWAAFKVARSWVEDGLLTNEQKVEIMAEVHKTVDRPNGTFSVRRYAEIVTEIDHGIRQTTEYDLGHDEAPEPESGAVVGGSASAMSTLEESS